MRDRVENVEKEKQQRELERWERWRRETTDEYVQRVGEERMDDEVDGDEGWGCSERNQVQCGPHVTVEDSQCLCRYRTLAATSLRTLSHSPNSQPNVISSLRTLTLLHNHMRAEKTLLPNGEKLYENEIGREKGVVQKTINGYAGQ